MKTIAHGIYVTAPATVLLITNGEVLSQNFEKGAITLALVGAASLAGGKVGEVAAATYDLFFTHGWERTRKLGFGLLASGAAAYGMYSYGVPKIFSLHDKTTAIEQPLSVRPQANSYRVSPIKSAKLG